MKACPRCKQLYPDGLTSCPKDGMQLVDESVLAGQTLIAVAGANTPAPIVTRGSSAPPIANSLQPIAGSLQPIVSEPSMAPVIDLGAGLPLPDLKAGTAVGEYVVERRLGEGGMAVVYAGVQPLIGKKVAIKVLSPSLASEPDIVRRFIQEARAVNQIGHRNIIDIFSFGRLPDGRHYFVMELLDGKTLTVRINDRKQPIEWREATEIWLQVTSALVAAHARGIVHRDLKPDNLYLVHSPDGDYIKVLDFGIAKLMGDGPDMRKTATGIPMGTPIYMSPEQTSGRNVDHRTDVYAMGVMMYEMIGGAPPFDSDNYVEILHAHLNKPAPPLPTASRVNPGLEALVQKMLAKRPDQRPQTMEAVRAEMVRLRDEANASGQPLFVRPGVESVGGRTRPPSETERVEPRPAPPRPQPSRAPLYVVAIIVLAGAIGGMVVWGRMGAKQPAPKPEPAPVVEQKLAPPPPQPAPAAPTQQYGKIVLTLVPADAKDVTLTLNNRIIKEPALTKVETGFILLRAEAPGYEAASESFELKPDMEYPVTLQLKKVASSSKRHGPSEKKHTPENIPPPPDTELDKNGTMKPAFR
jgi:serine/threonine-protein kinase